MNTSDPNEGPRRNSASAALVQKLRISSAVISVAVIAFSALTGCSLPAVGPDYHRPDTAAAHTYNDAPDQHLVAGSDRVAGEWWRDFGDAELDRYVAEAL